MSPKKSSQTVGSSPSRVPILALAVCLIGVAAVVWFVLFNKPNPESLRDQALQGATTDARCEAAHLLTELQEDAVPLIREVAEKSDDENVVSICVMALSRCRDYTSMPLLFTKMDDESLAVRSAASNAVTKLLGRNHHFPAGGKPSERARIKEQMVKDWDALNGSELFEINKNRVYNNSRSTD